MNLFEFFYFSLYLSFLLAVIVAIQRLEETRIRINNEYAKESTVVENDAVDSDEEETNEVFDPEKENYTMTENPMLRHRTTVAEPVEAS